MLPDTDNGTKFRIMYDGRIFKEDHRSIYLFQFFQIIKFLAHRIKSGKYFLAVSLLTYVFDGVRMDQIKKGGRKDGTENKGRDWKT